MKKMKGKRKVLRKLINLRLSQNSTHFYNWIVDIVDFKLRSEIIPKFRYKFTL
jgi:hypothetical protein